MRQRHGGCQCPAVPRPLDGAVWERSAGKVFRAEVIHLGSSPNVKLSTTVPLAACHPSVGPRQEAGAAWLDPKVNCATPTPPSCSVILLSKGTAVGEARGPSTSHLSLAEPTCSRKPRVCLSSWGPWPGVWGLPG